MIDLIKAVQAALRASTTIDYVKSANIYITEDVRLLREAGGYPAIAIKDNGTAYDMQAGDQEEDILSLVVAVYVQLLKPEQAIIGNAQQPGVLQMATDVVAVLKDNLLAGTITQALPVRAGGSEILPEQNRAIQLLTIDFQFKRWS